jgi:hypothetical protein
MKTNEASRRHALIESAKRVKGGRRAIRDLTVERHFIRIAWELYLERRSNDQLIITVFGIVPS